VKFKTENGYVNLTRNWKKGDVITLELPMDIKVVKADEKVEADKNKVAISRGPLVYCAEWPDNNNGNVLSLMFDKNPELSSEFTSQLLNGVTVIKTKAKQVTRNIDSSYNYSEPVDITLIPYYSWNNRGAGEMMVWLPTDASSVYPQPAPTIANKSKVSASNPSPALKIALTDQYDPINSMDHTRPYFHWWPKTSSWEWVQYDFEKEETVSLSKVYWFDDGPFGGCRIPEAWKIQYQSGNKWVDVKNKTPYKVTKDGWDIIEFEPVKTTALRLNIKLPDKFSSGIHEWAVK
jgi:uncharacterized protein (DUF736 family)